jgi:ATP-dependent Lhr-like helicase
MTSLPGFLPVVAEWFAEAFGEPTQPQAEGWRLIAEGHHTLIVAPTGSGKTLAAFLWALDHLFRLGIEGALEEKVYLLYVSPLKALNNDIEKNLRGPLQGIRERAAAQGVKLPEIRLAVRTGDTLAHARQAMTRRPPHILITTPESLYLLLTGEKFRPALRTVRFAIVDEIHALAGGKRGVHLSLSLERLQELAEAPIQRIGCSATVRPVDAVAQFLVGCEWDGDRPVPRPCRIVDAGFQRALDLQVVAPVSDFLTAQSDTVWETVFQELCEWIQSHQTTLIFTPSRRMAERLARTLAERLPDGQVAAHHGSLSRRARLEAEERLKRGDLKALVATSSLELGIDIGAIDLVVQLQSPRNIAALLQRVGRSGHLLTKIAKGRTVVTKGEELVEAAALVRAIRKGELDRLQIPENPLDVLAQQIVSAVAAEPWDLELLYRLVRRSSCYRDLEREDFLSVVRMLADPLPHEVKGAGPRLSWDRVNQRLYPRRGSRLLALTSGGTIPDTGLYDVFVRDTDLKVGTLDEEFVTESLPGDVFLLGSHAWRLVKVQSDRVLVEDAAGMAPTVPFWRGEHPSRSWDLGCLVGRLRHDAALRLDDPEFEPWVEAECGLDPRAARALKAWLQKGRDLLETVPDDRCLVVESFPDELGGRQMVLHSVFGMKVNGAWGLALREALRRRFGLQAETSHVDDGILLAFAPGQIPPPPERLPLLVPPEEADGIVARGLIGSPLFTTRFRHAAVRSLFIPRMVRGERTPAWLQRLKADALMEAVGGQPDFPLVAEALRECCRDALDVPRLKEVLSRVRDGTLAVKSVETVIPSPFTYPLLLAWDWAYLDAGHAEERRSDAVPMLKAWSAAEGRMDPHTVEDVEAELQATTPRRRARDAQELAVLFEELGDLDEDELIDRVNGNATLFLDELRGQRRVVQTDFPNGRRAWISAADADLYANRARESLERILLRLLRRRGPVTVEALAARYGVPESELAPLLQKFEANGVIRSGSFLTEHPAPQYLHVKVLEEIHLRQLSRRRQGRSTVPAIAFAAFLLRWQHVHPDHRLNGPDGLLGVTTQLQGKDFPVSFWEQELFPSRLESYDPAWLDQLGLSGQLVWRPFEPGTPGRMGFALRENLPWLVSPTDAEPILDDRTKNLLLHLQLRGALFATELTKSTGLQLHEILPLLWQLFWQGLVTTDSFQTLRQGPLSLPKPSPPNRVPIRRRPTRREAQTLVRQRLGATLPLGRWSILPMDPTVTPETRAEEWARLLLSRFGILSRELASGIDWAALRQALTRMEYAGEVVRGYFVHGLSGEQYGLEEAIQDLDSGSRRSEPVIAVSLADPAVLWGSHLPLTGRGGLEVATSRSPRHLLLMQGRSPRLLAEGYGKTLVPLSGFKPDDLAPVIQALQGLLKRPPALRPIKRIEVHTWETKPIRESEAGEALQAAGFYPDGPRLLWDGYPGPRRRA